MASILPPGLEKVLPRTPPIDFTTELNTTILKGRSVLITGGASGIGLACVKAIASCGAYVTIVDLQQELGEATAKELSSREQKVQFVQCDVANYNSQAAAFRAAVEFGGNKLDVVITAAGVLAQNNLVQMAAETEPTLEYPPPEPGFSGVDVNLKGVYYTCYLALHYFRLPAPQGTVPFKKAIILVASAAGFMGFGHSTTYSISKFGIRGLLYGIRDKALEAGVRINLIAPWFVKTPMTSVEDSVPELHKQLDVLGWTPMGNVIDAVVRMSVDEIITGRSVMSMPEGNFDAEDDLWGGLGGVVAQERVAKRMGAIMKLRAEIERLNVDAHSAN